MDPELKEDYSSGLEEEELDLISAYHFASGVATERVKLASNLMLLAPPTELEDVFQDLRTIIDNDDELKDGIGSTFDQYNYENFSVVSIPGEEEKSVMLTMHNRLKEHLYWDPSTRQKFLFNPFDSTVQLLDSFVHISDTDAYESLQNALNEYVSSCYPNGTGMVVPLLKSESNDQDDSIGFAICISTSKSSPNNYWNGLWTSEWLLRFIKTESDPNITSATLQGTFSIKVHYFEDGNVQLSTNTTVLRPIEDINDHDAIFQIIKEEESKFQSNLNRSYDILSEETFKSLRRALPITKSKLDWDKIFAYKLGASLGNVRPFGGFSPIKSQE
jgi:capping protein alpha